MNTPTPDNTQIQFTPINELEQALLKAVTDPTARPEFYKTLLDHDVIMLAVVDPETIQKGTADQDTPIQVLTWMKGEEQVVPLFSAVERLQEAIKDSGTEFPYVVMKGQMLFAALSQGNLNAVLNPRCALGKEFIVSEMRELVSGAIFNRLAQEMAGGAQQEILLGQPAEEPTELLDALRAVFMRHDAIDAAHLALAQDPTSGQPPRVLIGLQASGSVDAAVSDADVIADRLPPEIQLEFVLMDGGDIDAYFLEQTTPFYRKGESYPGAEALLTDSSPDYDLIGEDEDDGETDTSSTTAAPAAAQQPSATASASTASAAAGTQAAASAQTGGAQASTAGTPASTPRTAPRDEKKPWWKIWE